MLFARTTRAVSALVVCIIIVKFQFSKDDFQGGHDLTLIACR